MKKFTRIIKSVYEKDIEKKIDAEKKSNGAASKLAVVSDLKQSLAEELDDDVGNTLVT